jgi:hypothetical protein
MNVFDGDVNIRKIWRKGKARQFTFMSSLLFKANGKKVEMRTQIEMRRIRMGKEK